jgi:hypothetical protein
MSMLHVIETATGKLLPDSIERTRAVSLAWMLDNSGFYYTRYPKKGEVAEGLARAAYIERSPVAWVRVFAGRALATSRGRPHVLATVLAAAGVAVQPEWHLRRSGNTRSDGRS